MVENQNNNNGCMIDAFYFLLGMIGILVLNFCIFIKFPCFPLALWIGLSQLIYVLPLVFYLKYKRIWGLMNGIIAGASLSFLLLGYCGLLVDSYCKSH